MGQKLHIPYCEFYITHVCNLACSGCNHFNDKNFRGWQKWDDYKSVYEQWSHCVNFGSIAILGGEPLLNPTFIDWAQGIADLWPKTLIRIISNGYRIGHVEGLYELVRNRPVQLWVGIHNKRYKKDIISRVQNFLHGAVKSRFDDSIPYQEKLYLTDSNNVTVVVEYNWWFHQGAIVKTNQGLSLHKSDPEKSHNNCHLKTCHTFFKGNLYKCGVAAVLPDYDQQFNLQLDQVDRNLLYSYTPLSQSDSFEQKKTFIEALPEKIAQCKFCPEIYEGQQLWSEEKKMLFIPR